MDVFNLQDAYERVLNLPVHADGTKDRKNPHYSLVWTCTSPEVADSGVRMINTSTLVTRPNPNPKYPEHRFEVESQEAALTPSKADVDGYLENETLHLGKFTVLAHIGPSFETLSKLDARIFVGFDLPPEEQLIPLGATTPS